MLTRTSVLISESLTNNSFPKIDQNTNTSPQINEQTYNENNENLARAYRNALTNRDYETANQLILEMSEGQNEDYILPFIENGAQAAELLLKKPSLTRRFLADSRIKQLLLSAGCVIDEKSILYYKQQGRRPSFVIEIDQANSTATMFNPKKLLAIGNSNTVRQFTNHKNEALIVKRPKELTPISAKKTLVDQAYLTGIEAYFNNLAYPNDRKTRGFGFILRQNNFFFSTCRLVAPYIKGKTAWELLHTTNCPHELAKIIAASAKELHRLHTLGIVHGDMNPANYLLEKDCQSQNYHARFIDFEHAYLLTNETATLWSIEIFLTTWIAPELCNDGADNVTPHTSQDIYSLGWVLGHVFNKSPCYHELLSTYPSINTFITNAQKEDPELRPNLTDFYNQLNDEINQNYQASRNEYAQVHTASSPSFGR